VLDNDILVEIAKDRPSSLDELAETGLTSRQLHLWGQQFLETVEHGMKSPLLERIHLERPDEGYLKRLDKLRNWRKKAAAEMDVESDIVLPRSFLLALAERGPKYMNAIMRPSPWRLEHFGSQILQVLGD
jgi:ribonuclease D